MFKKIILKQLELTNYRNIKHQVLKFDGNSKIIGDNRIGKTNTLESIYWLFTDSLLNGSKDIDQLKPLGDTKSVVRVSAIFAVDDKEISLGKEFQEEWVKTRGSGEMVFKGHTTTYIYNGVKQGTKGKYDSLFTSDFGIDSKSYQGIDIIQMLTNPLYLGKMGDSDDWKNFRSMIIDIVGDVNDDDVFAANPHLQPLKEDFKTQNGRTDQIIKLYRESVKSIGDDIIGYNANIELLEKTECPTKADIEVAKKGIEECDSNIRSLKGDSYDDKAINLIDQEILQIKNTIIELKKYDLEHRKKSEAELRIDELNEEKTKLLADAEDLVNARTNKLSGKGNLSSDISYLDRQITEKTAFRTNLIDELRSIDEKLVSPEIETECPHCHRPYEDKDINERIVFAVKSLNDKKTELILKGKENTSLINELTAKKTEKQNELNTLIDELNKLDDSSRLITTRLREVNDELARLSIQPSEEVVNPEVEKLLADIKAKEDERAKIRLSLNDKEMSVKSLIAQEQSKKENFSKVIENYNWYLKSQNQINEIKKTKEEKSKLMINFEQKIELVKEFVKKKLEMLDSNIKKVFGDVSFMLIEPQVNGGYSTVCKPYILGTNTLWKSGSKSEQITTGIAIVEKIKAALNLPDLPYLFDEGGEISNNTFETRFNTKSQLICVQVKEGINIPTVINI